MEDMLSLPGMNFHMLSTDVVILPPVERSMGVKRGGVISLLKRRKGSNGSPWEELCGNGSTTSLLNLRIGASGSGSFVDEIKDL